MPANRLKFALLHFRVLTGAGLDVQVSVVGIHLTAEHAAEFEFFKGFAQIVETLDEMHTGLADAKPGATLVRRAVLAP